MSFTDLWKNYPDSDPCTAKKPDGKPLFVNQCAIRVSFALRQSGVKFGTFPKNRKCWVHPREDHILAAKELADWLDRGHARFVQKSEIVTGEDWRTKVLDRTGIICFEDYYPPGESGGGDHIDLWNGSSLTGFGSWFRTRFGIVVPGFWSDFRKARKIRFFPVAK